MGDLKLTLRDSAAMFRWYRGPDSTGTQRQIQCNFDLYPDPAGVVVAVFRAGRRDRDTDTRARTVSRLDSRGDDLSTKSDGRNRNSVETTCLRLII